MDQLHSTMATSNFSSPGPNWYSGRLVPVVILSLCFILGVPGNIAVFILRPNWQNLSSLSQSLMLNLAVSDLICLLTLPVIMHALLKGWTFSPLACKLLAYVVYCTIYGSLLTVTGLSVQRYLVVVHQLECKKLQKRLLLILLWLVALILSIPYFVVTQLEKDQHGRDCRAEYSSDAQWVAVLMTETVIGSVFFGIVAFSYTRLQKRINQAALFNNPQTSRLITSTIVSLFLLWVPYYCINVLGVTAIGLKNEGLLKFYVNTWNIVAAVTFVNRCLNPLLYAFMFCKFCPKKEPVQQNQQIPQTPETTANAEP